MYCALYIGFVFKFIFYLCLVYVELCSAVTFDGNCVCYNRCVIVYMIITSIYLLSDSVVSKSAIVFSRNMVYVS